MNIKTLALDFYDYSIHFKGFSKPTIKRYRQVINFYRRFCVISNIEEINIDNLRALFFHGRTKRNWSPNTYIVYHKSLNVFFKWCVKNGHMDSNPISEIETPKLAKRLLPRLTKQDANKLLEIVSNYPYGYRYLRYRNYAIFATFLFTGIRKKELLNLKLNDIDIENMTLFVNQGKGGKDRIIPISDTLAGILSKYLIERKRLNKTCPEFFTSLNRNKGFTDSGLRRIVVKIRKASKIDFTIHRLRHTFATLMIEGGCEIFTLSKMLGHSKLSTTALYLAVTPEQSRSQMKKHPLNR